MNREMVELWVRSGNFAIIAGTPRATLAGLRDVLRDCGDAGYTCIPCDGVWLGEHETSYFIPRMDTPAARHFGRMYGQTCVIAGNAIVYCDGTRRDFLDCERATFTDAPPDAEGYTGIPLDNGAVLYVVLPALAVATLTARERIALLRERYVRPAYLPIHG